MAGENVEEFGPFARAPGVGHVPGDENEVERPGGVLGLKPSHDPSQALVAARPAPPALDAKAIALADDMDVGEMRDAPDAAAWRRGVEGFEVERLVHRGVGEAPDERSRREVSRHDDDGVGERRHDQMMGDRKIRGRSDPPRLRPDESRNQRRDDGEKNSGAGAAYRPHARQLGSAARLQGSLREMPDRLAAQGVSRLNAKRVERPEIGLCDAKQGPPAEPAHSDNREKQERGAEPVEFQESRKRRRQPTPSR